MRTVYEGRVFSVEVGAVQFPNGTEHEIAVVRHRPSVVLIPMMDDNRLVIIRQFRPAIARMMWELPAGTTDPGETPEDAAARECEEEIGLVPGKLERLGGFFPTPGICDEELIFFRASDLRKPEGAGRRQNEDEDIQPEVVTIAEARSMAARGDIIDLKTAFGLTLL